VYSPPHQKAIKADPSKGRHTNETTRKTSINAGKPGKVVRKPTSQLDREFKRRRRKCKLHFKRKINQRALLERGTEVREFRNGRF